MSNQDTDGGQQEAAEWRKVYWPNEEYPWGVLEGPKTPQHRDSSFGPFTDERIVTHCYHESDADAIITDHRKAAQAEALAKAGQELLIALANEQIITGPRLRLSHEIAACHAATASEAKE